MASRHNPSEQTDANNTHQPSCAVPPLVYPALTDIARPARKHIDIEGNENAAHNETEKENVRCVVHDGGVLRFRMETNCEGSEIMRGLRQQQTDRLC